MPGTTASPKQTIHFHLQIYFFFWMLDGHHHWAAPHQDNLVLPLPWPLLWQASWHPVCWATVLPLAKGSLSTETQVSKHLGPSVSRPQFSDDSGRSKWIQQLCNGRTHIRDPSKLLAGNGQCDKSLVFKGLG